MLGDLVVLGVLAAAMSAATAGLIKWAATARTPLRAGTVLFLLLMMVAMVGGALVYFLNPGTGSLIAGFWIASALMSVSVLMIFAAFLREVHRQEAGGAGTPTAPSVAFVGAVLLLVLVNEFLMGWTFSLAAGSISTGVPGGAVGLFASVVASPWFLFTMSTEMLLTAYFLRDRLPSPVVVVLVFQSVIMFLSPPALAASWWSAFAIYASSSLMIVLFVYLMEFIYRHRQLTEAFSAYLVRLLAIYGAMMMGLYLWLAYGSVLLFAASIVVEMVIFFDANPSYRAVLRRPRRSLAASAELGVRAPRRDLRLRESSWGPSWTCSSSPRTTPGSSSPSPSPARPSECSSTTRSTTGSGSSPV